MLLSATTPTGLTFDQTRHIFDSLFIEQRTEDPLPQTHIGRTPSQSRHELWELRRDDDSLTDQTLNQEPNFEVCNLLEVSFGRERQWDDDRFDELTLYGVG